MNNVNSDGNAWRAESKRRAALLAVAASSGLVVVKLATGVATGAVSIISEAAHSAVDLLAAVIAYLAVKNADRRPDSGHTFGHGKLENVSGVVEALLIVLAAIWIIWEAGQKFFRRELPEQLSLGMAVMALSTLVCWLVSRRLAAVAKKTSSPALAADAAHLRADVWSGGGVGLGLILIAVTGWTWIDPLIAAVVAGFIFRAGWRLTRQNFGDLIDRSLPEAEAAQIRQILAAHPAVRGYHRLRTRKTGSFRMIDMHVVMAHSLPLGEAHRVCDAIEEELEERLGPVDVIIHAEPCFEKSRHCPLISSNGGDYAGRSCNWCAKEDGHD
ncbi:MAG: cation diffusion facilitator family transporter [Negativicutes bacterium]|nr:cation diffusion facilitator family transporter [Negativicutes bacterium]